MEQNQLALVAHQTETDHKLEEVFRRLDSGNVQPHQGIFYDGQIFDAYTFINDCIREATTQQVMDLLRHTIRPEFLNRIDETIMFTLLNENQIRDIVGLQIEGVHKMLMQSGVDLRITDDAIDYIAREGYDPQNCNLKSRSKSEITNCDIKSWRRALSSLCLHRKRNCYAQ